MEQIQRVEWRNRREMADGGGRSVKAVKHCRTTTTKHMRLGNHHIVSIMFMSVGMSNTIRGRGKVVEEHTIVSA